MNFSFIALLLLPLFFLPITQDFYTTNKWMLLLLGTIILLIQTLATYAFAFIPYPWTRSYRAHISCQSLFSITKYNRSINSPVRFHHIYISHAHFTSYPIPTSKKHTLYCSSSPRACCSLSILWHGNSYVSGGFLSQ
jgi:hypothetical protein